MRVWLATIGEPLPNDFGNERLLRTGILAEMLSARGHQVTWWTSTFNHSTKTVRAASSETVRINPGYVIRMLDGGGYSRNVSFARLRDHRAVARQFTKEAAAETPPDVLIASLPSLELAEAATEYGKKNGVPVVVDIRDLWPDVFARAFPRFLSFLAPRLLRRFEAMASRACRDAYAIWGHAPGFVEWGLRHARRSASPLDAAFPHGYSADDPPAEEQAAAMKRWKELGISPDFDGLTVCFVGTIGHQTRIADVLQTAQRLGSESGIRFVVCGTGDRFDRLKTEARGLRAVTIAGWCRRAEIWSLLRMSDIGLVPQPDEPDFRATIPNKVPEYLSAGLALALNLDSGSVHDLISRERCGFSYHDSAGVLAEELKHLRDDRPALEKMRAASRALFEDRFRADVVYGRMIEKLEEIALNNRAPRWSNPKVRNTES